MLLRYRPAVDVLVMAMVSVSMACSGPGIQADEGPAPPTEQPTVVELPETPAGDQVSWVLEVLNSGEVDLEAIEQRFAPGFLDAVPAESVQMMLTEVAADGKPFSLIEVADVDSPTTRVRAILLDREDRTVQVDVVTTDVEPFSITLFAIRGAPWRDPTLPQSWAELEEAIRAFAPSTSVLGAEIVDGELEPIFSVEPERRLAIGSAFKLYVLGALAQAVEEGRLAWDDPLALNPDFRTMGSLALREVDDGAILTLREHAEPMIAVSDNTATDHLIHHVGREAVEAAQSAMGHGQPELNRPFLTTREMFMIKLVLTPQQRAEYVAAGEAERRRITAETAELDLAVAMWATMFWSAPRLIEEVEWFASGGDLCRAMTSLAVMTETEAGEPIASILSQNPGMSFDTSRWQYVGYKGGSEPGVLNLTWLLQRDDDRWYCLSMSFNDTEQDVSTDAALRLAAAAVNLLAR